MESKFGSGSAAVAAATTRLLVAKVRNAIMVQAWRRAVVATAQEPESQTVKTLASALLILDLQYYSVYYSTSWSSHTIPAAHGHWCAFTDLYHTIPYHHFLSGEMGFRGSVLLRST